jgi:hypothetical protein
LTHADLHPVVCFRRARERSFSSALYRAQMKHHSTSPLLNRRRKLSLLAVFGISFVAGAVTAPKPAAAAPAVCPVGSQGDRAFTMTNLDKCVWVNNDHNRLPRLGETVDYNIYCPGRIPTSGWANVGQRIAEGALIRDQNGAAMNPITSQHAARGLGVQFVSMPHVFHYGCVISGINGVATHIKVRVRATAAGPGALPKCTAFGSQNGDIALNARMDREYKCVDPQFRAGQRGSFDSDVKKTAMSLLRSSPRPGVQSDVARAAALGGKICLLESTDIQCAPCQWSDKLIVRVLTVPSKQSCPANSREVR